MADLAWGASIAVFWLFVRIQRRGLPPSAFRRSMLIAAAAFLGSLASALTLSGTAAWTAFAAFEVAGWGFSLFATSAAVKRRAKSLRDARRTAARAAAAARVLAPPRELSGGAQRRRHI